MAFLLFHKSTKNAQVFSTEGTEVEANHAEEYLYDTFLYIFVINYIERPVDDLHKAVINFQR